MTHHRNWSAKDVRIAVQMASMGKRPPEISKAIDRSIPGIEIKLRKLGVTFITTHAPAPKKPEQKVYCSPYLKSPDQSNIGFAETVLKLHGKLIEYRGITYLDNKIPTVITKMREANKILKMLGYPQIANCKDWVV